MVGEYIFQVGKEFFQAYISVNVNGTENTIRAIRGFTLVLLLLAWSLVGAGIAFLIRRTLRPIEQLTENSIAISNGDYHLRTNYKGADEVGQLSMAFDKMAESIEEKITSLDEELQKRQLLLGALSHEMKTPMTAIIGYADSLIRMPLNDQQKSDCAEKIYRAGKHTAQLSQKMMELVGLAKEEIHKVPIQTEVFAEHLRDFIPAKIPVTWDISPIWGDETLLLSLVVNLVENGLRASGDRPDISVHITAQGNFTCIIVKDHGCGIPKEQIPLIVEPFYRVDKARSRKHGGAGLGLTICREICACHGGSLHIESEEKQGTTVTAKILTT